MISISIILLLGFATSLKYDVNVIQRDNTYTDKLDKSDMKIYSVEIDNQLGENDLLIDSSFINANGIYETPITLISLVNYCNLVPSTKSD
jgi:hypothetical protein